MEKQELRQEMLRSIEADKTYEYWDIQPIHGKVFKKIRTERGVTLKDAAAGIISVQTLRRFEKNETSLTVEIFEKLLTNLRLNYSDFLIEYMPQANNVVDQFMMEFSTLLQQGNYSAVTSLCVKELKQEPVPLIKRFIIARYSSQYAKYMNTPQIIKYNAKIVLESFLSMDKLSLPEKICLNHMISIFTKEDISVIFIRRLIEENLNFVPTVEFFAAKETEMSINLLLNSIDFLARNGYEDEAEKYCGAVIEKLREKGSIITGIYNIILNFYSLLAEIKLRKNSEEGIALANKCINQMDIMINFAQLPSDISKRLLMVQKFYELNKTGVDFDL